MIRMFYRLVEISIGLVEVLEGELEIKVEVKYRKIGRNVRGNFRKSSKSFKEFFKFPLFPFTLKPPSTSHLNLFPHPPQI
jgi:hypothetical protein